MPSALGAVVDCETTGLTDDDEIIELALILFEYDTDTGAITGLVRKYTGLREPSVPCSAGALAVHWISPQSLRGRSINKQEVFRILIDAQLIFAHNAEFDRRFLRRLYPDIPDRKWICTMKHILWGMEGIRSVGLDEISSHYSIIRPVSHRAYADAMTVLSILRRQNSVFIPHIKQLHERAHRPKLTVGLKYSLDEDPIEVSLIDQDDELILRKGNNLQLVLWSKQHLDFINAYLYKEPVGSGRVLKLDKGANPRLNSLLDEDYDLILNLLSCQESRATFSVVREVRRRYAPEALEEYHSLRGKNRDILQTARAMEHIDLMGATNLYQQAFCNISKYANLKLQQGASRQLEEQERETDGIHGHIEIIDRLTLCLSRLGRRKEAILAAEDYFSLYKKDIKSAAANKIMKRVSKYK